MNAKSWMRAVAFSAMGALSTIAWADGKDSPAGSGDAAEAEAQAPSVAELEEAFWLCDFAASTLGVRATPVAACILVTEALKEEKFSGNFDNFVGWWREHKAEEHNKLEKRFIAEAKAGPKISV